MLISGFKWYLNLSMVGATGPKSITADHYNLLNTKAITELMGLDGLTLSKKVSRPKPLALHLSASGSLGNRVT